MRFVVVASALLLLAQTHFANAFSADPEKLCIGSPGSRRIDPDNMLWELFKERSISPTDLNISRKENSYDLRVRAILDPRSYCEERKCGRSDLKERMRIEKGLYGAQGDLLDFWSENLELAKESKFHTSPATAPAPPDRILEAFFREAAPAKAVCIDKKKEATAPPTKPAKPDPIDKIAQANAQMVAPELRIRKSVSDLSVSQSDEKFASIERASFAFARDYKGHSETYNFEGVIGLASPSISLDSLGVARFNVIPYIGYTRQVTHGVVDPDAPNVQNIRVGVLGNWLVPIGNYFQNWQVSPEVVHSYRTNATILSGKASWTPDAPIPGFGFKYHPYQGSPVSFLVKPQFTAAYVRVLHDGGDPNLSVTKDFVRLGSSVTAAWFLETGPLNGLSYSVTYSYLRVISHGTLRSLPRFETALSYTMPDQQFWSWDLKYIDGRDPDTFEEVRQLTLGVGLRY